MQPTKQTTIITIVAVVAAVLITGTLGYMVGQSNDEPQRGSSQPTSTLEAGSKKPKLPDTEHEVEELAKEGVIIGTLTYPSEGIPPEVVIHAYNIDTQEEFTTSSHIQNSRFKYGKGYAITVPPGRYHVYGVYEEVFPDQRAYFDEYIKCQLANSAAECTDFSKIIVTVKPGEEHGDAIVGNWYKTCVIPGGKQPTRKFDLPTC